MIVVAKIMMLLTTLLFVSGAVRQMALQGKPTSTDMTMLAFGMLNGLVAVLL